MPDSADISLCHRDLSDRLVIDMATTEAVGRVAHMVVDVKAHQVEGLVCNAGFLSPSQPIPWVQIESIGLDSIVVRLGNQAISEKFDAALPLEGQEIWTDVGNRVGRLVDYCFDGQTGAITQYLFTAPGWQGLTDGVYLFTPDAVVSAGRKRMMVRHTALINAPQYRSGLPDRAAEFWQEDASQTRQDVQAVLNSTQDLAGQVQSQAQKLGDEARSRFGQLLGQVKQRTKKVRTQVNDRVADVAANIQDQRDRKAGDKLPGTTIDVDSEAIWPEGDESPPEQPPQS
ncbi:PRC-barrel domain-containing protein [Leptolyngbya sp. PCC 6406]|uniref:PRC-barrel domain-containing protein n=1 Tax=Leptolyngbya sp. PCC 6406 TaxID=1173264 RepID=UPI0002ACD77E|nr:PRC-barrel domain-containing protein [Leptolyngbya sp. PCC 6406]